MHTHNNVLQAPIDADDGDVARSPSEQENNNPTAIRRLIAVGKVASFGVRHAGNKIAMSASSDALEASIAAFSAAKEGNVALSFSPAIKNKRSAGKYLFAVVKTLPFASTLHVISCNERF